MAKKRLLDRIKDDMRSQGIQARTLAAKFWLQRTLQSRTLNFNAKRTFVNANLLSNNHFNASDFIGHLFFFIYDAKLKKRLPYWDKFPLTIPIEMYNDGFLGLNLHYLHPSYRAILLDKLETTLTDKNYDARTKMRINYSYLKRASKILPPEAKPCIKRYLYPNLKSKLLPVSAEDWEIVIFLPWEEYTSQTQTGVTKQKVWSDSNLQF